MKPKEKNKTFEITVEKGGRRYKQERKFSSRNKQREIERERENLRNLSGFATTRFANDNGGGVILNQIENGGAVFVDGQSLSQPLDTQIPKSASTTEIE